MKKRLIETAKNILIILLLCSLLLLVAASLPAENIRNTPWLSTVLQPFGRILNLPQAELSYVETEIPVLEAALPLTISIRNHAGRTTFMWNFNELDSAFETLGRLLGEAMDTAGEPHPVTAKQLKQALSGNSIYFSYGSSLPASLLAAWLDVSFSAPTESISACVLSAEADTVYLYLLGSSYYSAPTRVSPESMQNLLDAYRPDGSALGFESSLSLHDLAVLPAANRVVYAATRENPCTSRFMEQLAANLGFNPYGDTNYTNAQGETFYSETNCDLILAPDGMLTLQTKEIERFRAAGSNTEEIIEEARRLLNLTAGDSMGDARLYLTEVTKTETQTVCAFDYFLSGIPVELPAEHAATATFTDSYLTELKLQLVTYRTTGTAVNLFPAVHAAAILPEGSQLLPTYQDNGSPELTAGWKKNTN